MRRIMFFGSMAMLAGLVCVGDSAAFGRRRQVQNCCPCPPVCCPPVCSPPVCEVKAQSCSCIGTNNSCNVDCPNACFGIHWGGNCYCGCIKDSTLGEIPVFAGALNTKIDFNQNGLTQQQLLKLLDGDRLGYKYKEGENPQAPTTTPYTAINVTVKEVLEKWFVPR